MTVTPLPNPRGTSDAKNELISFGRLRFYKEGRGLLRSCRGRGACGAQRAADWVGHTPVPPPPAPPPGGLAEEPAGPHGRVGVTRRRGGGVPGRDRCCTRHGLRPRPRALRGGLLCPRLVSRSLGYLSTFHAPASPRGESQPRSRRAHTRVPRFARPALPALPTHARL